MEFYGTNIYEIRLEETEDEICQVIGHACEEDAECCSGVCKPRKCHECPIETFFYEYIII